MLTALTLAFVLAFSACLRFVQVHDYVENVDGAISTDIPPTKLIAEDQHLISHVYKQLGDVVRRGEPLVQLDGRRQRIELVKLEQAQESKTQELKYNSERLRAIEEKLEINANIAASKARLERLEREQVRMTIAMDAKRREAATQIEAISERIIERAMPALDSPALSEIEKARILSNAHADLRQMHQVSVEFQSNLQRGERDALESRIEIAELSNDRADLQLAKADAERAIASLSAELDSIRQERAQIEDALTRLLIRAPASGEIVRVSQNVLSANLIERNEELFLIRNTGSDLEAELVLTDEQYRDARVGQKVNLELHAWNHYKYGAIEGEIIELSSSKIQPQVFQSENPAFIARVRIRPGQHRELQAGYELKARIVLGRVTLFDYLLKKIRIQ